MTTDELRNQICSILFRTGHVDQWNKTSGKHYEYWRHTSPQMLAMADDIVKIASVRLRTTLTLACLLSFGLGLLLGVWI